MKSECPKCGAKNIMRGVSCTTGGGGLDDFGIVVWGKRSKSFLSLGNPHRSIVKADVCSGCGFMELYARSSDLQGLWNHYVSAGKTQPEY